MSNHGAAMSPDAELLAVLTLAAYLLVAVAGALAYRFRSTDSWSVWILYCTERVYIPFVFGWRANGKCPFPENGPALVIANHRSPVDPLMIWMNHNVAWRSRRIRIISFITAREFCVIRGVRWITHTMRSIPVDRTGSDMGPAREALRRLHDGELIGVFPEGRINTGPGLLDANPGIAWLALRAKVPVFPVFLHSTPQGKHMVEPFYTFSRVRVTYGEPIDLSAYHGRPKSRQVLEEVTLLLMRRLAETGGLPPEAARVADRNGEAEHRSISGRLSAG